MTSDRRIVAVIFVLISTLLAACDRSTPIASWQYRITEYSATADKCVVRASGEHEQIVATRNGPCTGIKTGDVLTEFSSTDRSVTPVNASPDNRGSERFIITEAKQK